MTWGRDVGKNSLPDFVTAAQPPRLRGRTRVDVWLVAVGDEGPLGLHAASSLLGDAAQLAPSLPPDDRRRSIVARGALVRLVARRAGIAADRVSMGRDANGRPLICAGSELEVSIAHAGGLVAAAVSPCRVGVDLEAATRPEADGALAARICTPAELRLLEATPERSRRAELVRLWARKEALAKALGIGLALPFERTDVSRRRPRLDGRIAREWWLRDITDPPAGYLGAVAGQGRMPAISVSRFGCD